MPISPDFYQPNFLPAQLCSNNERGTFIMYAVRDTDGTLNYKYIKLNRYKRKMPEADFATFAADMIKDINLKLINATNTQVSSRHDVPVCKALDAYIDDKARELRPETLRTYKSFCKIFGEWCSANVPHLAIGDLRPLHAVRFMEYYYNVRLCGNNSYNNNIKWGRCVFEWLKAHCYCDVNIFAGCQRKRGEPKKRTLIDAQTRKRISDYLMSTKQYGFLLALHLVYSALIRPKEIAELHICDVYEKYIVVPESVAKNHHKRISAITPEIAELLRLIRIDTFPVHYYLLGSDMLPARSAVNIHRFTKKWAKLRDEMQLPTEMQLYSLRDSGISDLLRSGLDPITVMHHADHHSLEITTRYANHVDAHLVDMLYNRGMGF